MIEIIPGILEKDFSEIKKKMDLVIGLVDWVQIDILDNTLINLDTYNNWEDFRIFTHQINIEAHLMVSDPEKDGIPLVKNGFKRLVAHVEGNTLRDFLNLAKAHEVETGVALDSPTPVETVEPFLEEIDVILVMMYKAGPSGQTFMPQNLLKIKKIHAAYPNLAIEVDGGIDDKTAPLVVENGATRLVSTSFLYWKNQNNIKEAIEKLQLA
jgi:ribulose-phosphate 3-epimerase